MASLAVIHLNITDQDGNILNDAAVTIRNGHASGGNLADIYADAAGSTALSNPVTVDGVSGGSPAAGVLSVYVAPGAYRLEGTLGGGEGFSLIDADALSPATLASYGVRTYETPALANAAVDAMSAGEKTAHQAALEDAFLNNEGRLVIDGYVEVLDKLVIGNKCEVEMLGGIAGEQLVAGLYVTNDNFNMSATSVVEAGKTGSGSYAPYVRSLHLQFDQSSAAASGNVSDAHQYPWAFDAKEGFGQADFIRVTAGWNGVRALGPTFSPPNADNVGGWTFKKLQLGCLNKDYECGNGFHHINTENLDSWVWGLNGNLQNIRNRDLSGTNTRREAITLKRGDGHMIGAMAIFQGGRIIYDPEESSTTGKKTLPDQITKIALDGDYSRLEMRNGNTQVAQVYGTENAPSADDQDKILITGGQHNFSQGYLQSNTFAALLNVASNLDEDRKTVVKYSGRLRQSNINGQGAIVSAGTLILENCEFIVETDHVNTPFIEQSGTGILKIRNCTARQRNNGAPIPVWKITKFNVQNPDNEFDDWPVNRFQMVRAIAGDGLSVSNAESGGKYTISSIGTTTQSDWNDLANTTGVTYAAGDDIVAAISGSSIGGTGEIEPRGYGVGPAIKGNYIYDIDGLPYKGVGGATAISDLPGLVHALADPVFNGTATGTAVQSDPGDTTSGRLMAVGAFGLGGDGLTRSPSSIDALTATGVYKNASNIAGITEPGGLFVHLNGDAGDAHQVAFRQGANRYWVRRKEGGVWGDWFQFISSEGGTIDGELNVNDKLTLGPVNTEGGEIVFENSSGTATHAIDVNGAGDLRVRANNGSGVYVTPSGAIKFIGLPTRANNSDASDLDDNQLYRSSDGLVRIKF